MSKKRYTLKLAVPDFTASRTRKSSSQKSIPVDPITREWKVFLVSVTLSENKNIDNLELVSEKEITWDRRRFHVYQTDGDMYGLVGNNDEGILHIASSYSSERFTYDLSINKEHIFNLKNAIRNNIISIPSDIEMHWVKDFTDWVEKNVTTTHKDPFYLTTGSYFVVKQQYILTQDYIGWHSGTALWESRHKVKVPDARFVVKYDDVIAQRQTPSLDMFIENRHRYPELIERDIHENLTRFIDYILGDLSIKSNNFISFVADIRERLQKETKFEKDELESILDRIAMEDEATYPDFSSKAVFYKNLNRFRNTLTQYYWNKPDQELEAINSDPVQAEKFGMGGK